MKKKKKPLETALRKGTEFFFIGAGKAGPIASKKDKLKSSKNQRQMWKSLQSDIEYELF